MVMKTYKPRPKKIAWSEANKESCRKMKWKNAGDADGGGRRSDAQCSGGPAPPKASVPSRETARQSAVFLPVTKWTNYTTDLITRSSPLMLQTMRGNAQKSSSDVSISPSSLLPPIRGSRIPSSAVIAAIPFISKAVHPEDSNAELLTRMRKENALFRLYMTNQWKPSNFKARLINGNVAPARAKNHLVAVRCQPVKSAEEQRSSAINTGSSDCEAVMCAVKSASGKKELSGDTAEAGPHCDRGRAEWTETDVLGCLQSGDYYTEQRISEWILNVNASLFCPSGSVGSNGPSEEQDTSIKIVYDRE